MSATASSAQERSAQGWSEIQLARAERRAIVLAQQKQAESAARLLAGDLLIARNEAIKRNAIVLVCADGGETAGACKADPSAADWSRGWRVCWAAAGSSSCAQTMTDRPNPIRMRGNLNPSVVLTAPATALRFAPDGSIDATAYSAFELRAATSSQGTWRLNFMRSGSITVRKV